MNTMNTITPTEMNTPTEKGNKMENKNDIKDFIRTITDNYNKDKQEWLNLTPNIKQETNENTKLDKVEGSMRRRKQWYIDETTGEWVKPTQVRRAGVDSVSGDCQRSLMFAMFGLSQSKKVAGQQINKEKGGTIFNNALDEIIREKGNGRWLVGNQKKADGFSQGSVFLNFNTMNHDKTQLLKTYYNVDKETVKVVSGVIDFYDTKSNTIIELKSVRKTERHIEEGIGIWDEGFYDELPSKAKKQVSIYIDNLNRIDKTYVNPKGGWVVYLPTDLSTLDADDETTYRAYYVSKTEARKVVNEEVLPPLKNNVTRLMWNTDGHNSKFVWGTKSWFFELLRTIPKCGKTCCESSEQWFSEHEVDENWNVIS